MNIDSARTVQIHAEIIKKNIFLRKVYESFYKRIQKSLFLNEERGTWSKTKKKIIVELGSGGGFIKEIIPQCITSDVVRGKGIDKVFPAEKMPFTDKSVDAFVMLNVFHHIKDVKKALSEMQRCLKKNGKIVMIEPWNTPFSRFIYQNFHHETFNPYGTWNVEQKGRLSGANGAIPWIVFKRDRNLFENTFPHLKIKNIKPHTPFVYILSGGLSRPPLFPAWTVSFFTTIESLLSPLFPLIALFTTIEVQKIK